MQLKMQYGKAQAGVRESFSRGTGGNQPHVVARQSGSARALFALARGAAIFYCGGHADHPRPGQNQPHAACAGTPRDRRLSRIRKPRRLHRRRRRAVAGARRRALARSRRPHGASGGRGAGQSRAPRRPRAFRARSGACPWRVPPDQAAARGRRHWRRIVRRRRGAAAAGPRQRAARGRSAPDGRRARDRLRRARLPRPSCEIHARRGRGCERAAGSPAPARRADQPRRRGRDEARCSSGSAFPPASARTAPPIPR